MRRVCNRFKQRLKDIIFDCTYWDCIGFTILLSFSCKINTKIILYNIYFRIIVGVTIVDFQMRWYTTTFNYDIHVVSDVYKIKWVK